MWCMGVGNNSGFFSFLFSSLGGKKVSQYLKYFMFPLGVCSEYTSTTTTTTTTTISTSTSSTVSN